MSKKIIPARDKDRLYSHYEHLDKRKPQTERGGYATLKKCEEVVEFLDYALGNVRNRSTRKIVLDYLTKGYALNGRIRDRGTTFAEFAQKEGLTW